MMKAIKKFIKQYPLFWKLQQKRYDRICDRHSRMSYAEIEAAIGRKYEEVFGRKLNWDNPQTYNEKIHVSKLYMPSELKTRLADKYLVREWIREKIGDEYLIPLLGVYDSFDEIDFDALPDKFVIKCNHDSGSVMLIKDKSKINKKLMKAIFDTYMKRNYGWWQWEIAYRDIKPKITIEQFMGDTIKDYKFVCFDGKPYYCWVDFDRFTNHTRNFYSLDWELQSFGCKYKTHQGVTDRPTHFDEMKRIAKELCKGFPHVRVDVYLIDGRIYFGEMTFSSENGFGKFTPDEWDYKLGELWPLDNSIRQKVLAQSSKP